MALPLPFEIAIQGALDDKAIIDAPDDMARYLAEERGLYEGRADMVLRPSTAKDVSTIVKFCNDMNVPLIPQGGNTGLCGGAVADGGVILSLERMNKIRNVDAVDMTMTVEAGVILQAIQDAADEKDCLFPLSLGAEGTCQIGGNLSTNAGGNAVLRYGNARDLVLGLEVVLPNGEIVDGLRSLRKDNTGYDLKHLFMGAEGTLGIITAAVLKLFPKPKTSITAMVAADSNEAILSLFSRIKSAFGDNLTAYEFISDVAFGFVQAHIDGAKDPFEARHRCYALVELTSPRKDEGLNDALEELLGTAFEDEIVQDAVIAASDTQAKELWHIRETIPEAQKSEGGSIKHDVAVPVSKVPEFLTEASRLVEELIPGVRVCDFGHLGDGNIHFNLSQPVGADKQAYLARWHEVNRVVHDYVLTLNGSFSAEHGIGRLKKGDLKRYKSKAELDLMKTIKKALDPKGIMNPGKIIDPG